MNFLFRNFGLWGLIHPQTFQVIAIAFGDLPELDKTLLLKSSHTWVTEHREIKLVLSWKPQPYGLVAVVLEGVVHAKISLADSINFTKS